MTNEAEVARLKRKIIQLEIDLENAIQQCQQIAKSKIQNSNSRQWINKQKPGVNTELNSKESHSF